MDSTNSINNHSPNDTKINCDCNKHLNYSDYNDKIKILLFEYAVGSGEVLDNNILGEGKLMFDKLLNDFLSDDNIYVISIVDEKYKNQYNSSKYNNSNLYITTPDGDYKSKIIDMLENFDVDYALIIAPECNNILYNLTKLIEKYEIKNLGSSSNGVKIAGNKYLTYLKIKDAVSTPKTFELDKYVIKEIDGCGGNHKIIDENYIIQEFVGGKSYSVSFIVQNVENSTLNSNKYIYYPLSLNKQYIKECYCGGEVNIYHPLKERIISESIKALNCIDGLNGYVGVDVIVNKGDVHILEINARITTSIAGLTINPPLSKLLMDNILGRCLKYTLEGSKKFIRKDGRFYFI